MRRSTFEDEPVDYAAVGSTQASDLMQYPPEGFVPFEQSLRLGSGEERFGQASASLLSWSVQKASGVQVSDLHTATGPQYGGVRFAEDGTALEPIPVSTEQKYAEDGTPYVTAGTTASIHGRVGRFNVDARVRVVYVIDEPRTVAFAYGTVRGHRVSGEEAFILEHRDDDSVWFTVRAVSRPVTWYYRLIPGLAGMRRKRLATTYLRALSPLWSSPTA
ncbi:DUF1990 domain-containing protein [Okibacterium endophyticum]